MSSLQMRTCSCIKAFEFRRKTSRHIAKKIPEFYTIEVAKIAAILKSGKGEGGRGKGEGGRGKGEAGDLNLSAVISTEHALHPF